MRYWRTSSEIRINSDWNQENKDNKPWHLIIIISFYKHCTIETNNAFHKLQSLCALSTLFKYSVILLTLWHWIIKSGPNFIELLSTKICLAWNFFLDKNRIANQISICCMLLSHWYTAAVCLPWKSSGNSVGIPVFIKGEVSC